ncbi:MutS protein msh4 [Xanthoria calcicola]
MAGRVRPRVSYTSASTSYPEASSTTPRPDTRLSSNGRPPTGRPRTAASTLGSRDQQVICAISESRGISPVVGLAFVNLTTTEAVLCQISDNQTFTRTIHKLVVYEPTELLFMTTAAQPKSKLFNIVEYNIPNLRITVIDRRYWSETTGLEYIQHLAFKQDVEAIKVSVGGNFYATCCIAAVLKYIELALSFSFPFHSLRIKYETSEGSMMIDLSTISSMELIQNLQNPKSKDCLFGLLNQTLTPMGSRLLKSLLLQPSTNVETLEKRFDALDELATREDIFFAVRHGNLATDSNGLIPSAKTTAALKAFLDVDRVLTAITIIPTKPTIQYWEQSINNVIALKQYVNSIPAVFEALTTVKSELLLHINELCAPESLLIFEISSGVNGLLDVARQTYKEANADAYQLVTDLGQTHSIALEMKYDTARQYYIRIATSELEDRNLPEIFINSFRKKNFVECQTLDLLKLNQKIADSHHEVLQMSDGSVQELVNRIREDIAPLFKTCEAIALLDMIASFAQLVTVQDYCRPELTDTLAIKSGRHPIREKIHTEKFVPNDAYATQQSRFQIITGCNMSGKSTYIRSLALMTVMAQIGCFVPAAYASFPIRHQMFARISTDDSIEANVSTFASEMREMAFILRNIDKRSMVIVDELGRGTSTRDGLTIAIAIAEALIESRALVWFATHFRDLAHILSERSGVVNLHLAVDMSEANDKMTMFYKVTNGWVQETHYGIAMAKVAGLPADVIRTAEEVSSTLARNIERQKKNSKTIALAKRRKLILGLREQLKQAQDGNMQGRVLGMWLSKLQDEFVRRMAAIDEEVERLEDEEILDAGRESLAPGETLAAEIQDLSREVRDQENRMMEDRSSSEDADGLVQDIPGASRIRRGLYEMSGALPVE